MEGKNFYKDFDFTSKILAFSDFKVTLNAFYGRILPVTQLCFSMSCFFLAMFQNYKYEYGSFKEGTKKDENFCCCFFLYSLAFPFSLLFSIFFALLEFLRIIIWALTLFHCFQSRNFTFRNSRGSYLVGFEGEKVSPPFPSKKDLLRKFQNDHNSLVAHVTTVEEELSFSSCCAILLFGVSSCKKIFTFKI